MLTGWRIASPKYSQSHEQAMSGEGAFKNGGRWNSVGTRLVYLGSSRAQAFMEMLVHLNAKDVLNQYHLFSVSFEEEHVEHIDAEDLPDGWAKPTLYPITQPIGDQWIEENSSLILEVPSAAIHGETNYLLNPLHPDAEDLALGPIEQVSFDPRVLKKYEEE